jgi:predicted MPP superfamily phosphohydrolase
VRLAGLPEALAGLRLAQLTDLHIGRWFGARRVREVVSLTNSRDADLLVLTGDFVGFRAMRSFEAALPELAALKARLGVFACLGNHDHWEGVRQVRAALERIGIRVLVDESQSVAPGLHLSAIDDLMMAEPDLEAVTGAVPGDEAGVLLSHNPIVLPQVAGRPWLVLAGHTHGGQLALPGPGPRRTTTLPLLRSVVRAYESVGVLMHRGRLSAVTSHVYPAGWYVEGRACAYVCRGVGPADMCPLRLNCPAEIACFTLHPGGQVTEPFEGNDRS